MGGLPHGGVPVRQEEDHGLELAPGPGVPHLLQDLQRPQQRAVKVGLALGLESLHVAHGPLPLPPSHTVTSVAKLTMVRLSSGRMSPRMVTMAAMVWCILRWRMLPLVSSTSPTCFAIGVRFSGAVKW